MNNLVVLRATGDHDPEEVIQLYTELAELARRAGNMETVGRFYPNRANESRRVGDPEMALEMADQAVETFPEKLPPRHWPRRLRIEAFIDLGRIEEAPHSFRTGVWEWWELTQDLKAMPSYFIVAGRLTLSFGRPESAAEFLGIVHGIRERGGVVSSEQVVIEEFERELRGVLAEDELAHAVARGYALAEDQAIDLLLNT